MLLSVKHENREPHEKLCRTGEANEMRFQDKTGQTVAYKTDSVSHTRTLGINLRRPARIKV